MNKRGGWVENVLSQFGQAEHFLKRLRQDGVEGNDPRMQEWSRVTISLFCFVFGELSLHTRSLKGLLCAEEPDRGLYFYRLSRCLYQARRQLQKQGMPGAEHLVPEGFDLSDYRFNREYERERTALRSWWLLFWSNLTFEKYRG